MRTHGTDTTPAARLLPGVCFRLVNKYLLDGAYIVRYTLTNLQLPELLSKMPCKLKPRPGSPIQPGIPSGPHDFDADVNAEITVFVQSASGAVHLTAAKING